MPSKVTNIKKTKVNIDKQFAVWLVLGFLLVTLCISWISFTSYVKKLESATQGHSLVEYINASTQRLVKLEMTGTISDELIFNLDNMITELNIQDGEESEYFGNHADILQGIADVDEDWTVTKEALEQYRVDGDITSLLADSERIFYHAANLTNFDADYISELSASILRMQLLIIVQMLGVVLIVGHRLFLAFMELKRNRELSASMFIDTATGLFNRSKCHEILRTITEDKYSRVMIVFDLNDLKKTNDQYGHRVGDELIYSFAQIIKEGTQIHKKDVFIGRYGGDEFMVYYNSIDEDGIRLYLDEVAFLAEAYNEKEARFQISYAAGYAISSKETSELTLRQLFDIADQDMYRNKEAIKKNQAEKQYGPAYGILKER